MRVAFHTLGCKVNQYETEAMKEAFVSRGALIVGEDEIADVYIVNTCTVTHIADRKSRQYIRRKKSMNPDALIAVTGCYAQVEPDEIAGMPEVNLVIGNGLKSTICDEVFRRFREKKTYVNVLPRNELTEFEDMGIVVSSESAMTRAYIKIQEGCDRFCSYCLIPFARGTVRSRSPEKIMEEARLLIDSGYKELVLTGINTALYGTEESFEYNIYDSQGNIRKGLEPFGRELQCDVHREPSGSDSDSCTDEDRDGERLPDIAAGESFAPIELLLAELNAMEGDFRIRLSSLEPTVVDKHDVERIIKYDKLCHHLHLSAQSGSSRILKLMNRKYTQDEYLAIVRAIREYDPLYGITTDIIVGFSGETEADFEDSLKVVRESEFGKTHIFRYSKRRGTAGEKMPDEVPGAVKNERAGALAEAAEGAARAFVNANLGHEQLVLTEERSGPYVTGYTGNYIRAYIKDENESLATGEFYNVKLTQIFEDGCLAEIC